MKRDRSTTDAALITLLSAARGQVISTSSSVLLYTRLSWKHCSVHDSSVEGALHPPTALHLKYTTHKKENKFRLFFLPLLQIFLLILSFYKTRSHLKSFYLSGKHILIFILKNKTKNTKQENQHTCDSVCQLSINDRYLWQTHFPTC